MLYRLGYGQRSTLILRLACRYWYLSQFSVKSPQIEVGPQYIVIINHPGHYMKISELELPQHLYAETTSPCGPVDKLIAPDMLVSWAEQGRGDAIYRLCHTVYERRLASINVWESDRIQQLEEELMVSGNDKDMSGCKYVNVKHYHTTREDIVREAELNRASVKERMTEHQTAIEELVKDAREFISAFTAQQDEGDMLTYLLVIVVIVAAGYAFFI
jgi:hypothetical protein